MNETVRMPSDNDKMAQAAGAVTTSNIHKPLKLAEFNRLDKAAKKHYLQWLSDTFNASDNDIGQLLGASQSSIYNQRRALGLDLDRRRMTADQREAWEEFMREREHIVEPKKETAEPAKTESAQPEKGIPTQADPAILAAVGALRDLMESEYKRGYEDAMKAMLDYIQRMKE